MTNDLENITKATHSTGFLLDELREVHKSENAIISDVAYDLIAQGGRSSKTSQKTIIGRADTSSTKVGRKI